MNVKQKIREKAKTLSDWEIECKQLIPENALKISNKSKKWIPYDTFHSAELVRLEDVSQILKPCVVVPVWELLEIYEDDENYISKKDLIKKLLGKEKLKELQQ